MPPPSCAISIVGYGFVINQPTQLHALLHVLRHGAPPTIAPPDTPLTASELDELDGLIGQKLAESGNSYHFDRRFVQEPESSDGAQEPVQVLAFYSLDSQRYGTGDDYAHGYTLQAWKASEVAGSTWFQSLPMDKHIEENATSHIGGLAAAMSFATLGIDVTLGWIHTLTIS
ncbi:hypothetical protein BDN72DRAFT_844832 [Pluteus cervinus]|uniref:Uncharacterized protein n=1 Tax=Pluteus cervinus TaxID=181527 RepID=A0ACD3AKK0_9AGAR|nr:hypothetical protein BDN72DRAFT_844832 [Pluteus cervinus]